MTDQTTFQALLQALDAGMARRSTLEAYYSGNQPMAYLAPEARAAIGSRFTTMSTNLCRTAVNALAERLRVVGFTGSDAATLWTAWQVLDLDQLAPIAHREALTVGESFIIVWADDWGFPTVTVESASQVAVVRDPATREVTAAIKRWETPKGTEAVIYGPDEVTFWHSDALGASDFTGFRPASPTVPNPFGQVPVVPLRNTDRLLGLPASELDDLLPLVDAMNKLLGDMLVASEYSGRPRRWATGIELQEVPVLDAQGNDTGETVAVNPFPDSNRMMTSEAPEAKFGQLDAADLASYEAAVRVIQAQISAVSGMPPHYLGVHGDQPASADALRASEASLVAKAEARQQVFGRAWEQVGRLVLSIFTRKPPQQIAVGVRWSDPATRSVAQEADAVVKLYAAGLLPAAYALRKLGYTDDEVREIESDRHTSTLLAS